MADFLLNLDLGNPLSDHQYLTLILKIHMGQEEIAGRFNAVLVTASCANLKMLRNMLYSI